MLWERDWFTITVQSKNGLLLSRPFLLIVRFQDIVNYFISKKSQDIANQIVELGCCAQ